MKDASQVLELVEVTIKEGRYKDAHSILTSLDIPEENNLRARYRIAQAAIRLAAGSYEEAEIDEAIELLRRGDQHVLFAEAKSKKAQMRLARGDRGEARELLYEAIASYKRVFEIRGLAKAHNRLAQLLFQSGDYQGAIEHLGKSNSAWTEIGESIFAHSCSVNIGMVKLRSGYLKDALVWFSEVSSHAVDFASGTICKLWLMYGLARCLNGEYALAYKCFENAVGHDIDSERERVIYYEYLGLAQLLDGRLAKSEESLYEAIRIAEETSPDSDLISQTKRLLADVYVAKKDYDRAKTVAEEALAVATKINERLEIAACHRVFGQVDSHRGEYDSAREWFRKAIDMLAMIGAQYELGVTRFDAAVSHAFSQKESVALLFLAKEYFAREQVKPYLDKTDRALHDLTAQQSKPEPARPAKEAPVVITQSRAMNAILEKIEYVAPSNMNILLLGETGTGKDLIARWIHHVSGRSGDFVSVNAAALPDNLVESELFGYKRGAYTGAESDRTGLLEQAAGGTFYLNEIAETTPAVQAKLLEVIESKRVRRLGENDQRAVDFRLIAATNRDLAACVQANRFRADLYHRLNEIPITLPSLRTRIEDILPLLNHFLQLSGANGQLTGRRADIARLAKTLASRIWPGNVRELQSEVRRLWVESRGDIDRMLELVQSGRTNTERREMLELLDACGGNRREMARRLNVSDSTVRYRLTKLGIDVPESVTTEF